MRRLTLADVPTFAEITRNAYPCPGDLEGATRYLINAIEVYEPNDRYGLFDGDQLVGHVHPVGNFATELLQKREGVAHDLVAGYLAEARQQGYTRWLDTVAGLLNAEHKPIWWNMHF